MTTIDQLLEQKTVLIADGAWGTELSRRGLEPGETPESWVLRQPDAVREVAQGYVDAGAEIILTDTFGGSRFKLVKSDLEDQVAEINRTAVELSQDAAGDDALVFASIGPTGEFM